MSEDFLKALKLNNKSLTDTNMEKKPQKVAM